MCVLSGCFSSFECVAQWEIMPRIVRARIAQAAEADQEAHRFSEAHDKFRSGACPDGLYADRVATGCRVCLGGGELPRGFRFARLFGGPQPHFAGAVVDPNEVGPNHG